MSHADRGHVEHAPSSASRWMACPGSIQLSRGVESQTSIHAIEGTTAHELGEQILQGVFECPELSAEQHAEQVRTNMDPAVPITDEMVDYVMTYVNYVLALVRDGYNVELERRVSLKIAPAPMGGTSDTIAYHPEKRTLQIVDLKYGTGVVVEVANNKQLRYYALAAMDSQPYYGLPVDKVITTIVQPRAPHVDGPIRSAEYTWEELQEFRKELIAAAEATLQENPPLVTGSHCRWCPALGKCPEMHKQSVALARIEFGEPAPKPPAHIPIEQVAGTLKKMENVQHWLNAMKAAVIRELAAGRPVPGLKLVAKKGKRQWTDPEAVEKWLAKKGLLRKGKTSSLRSPAQLEKVLGKKGIPKELVVTVSNGLTLAEESDPRPAVQINAAIEAVEEFDAIEFDAD